MINILISIINWNSASDTILCLDSVLALNFTNDNFVVKIIVIDNSSNTPDINELETWLGDKNITLVKNDRNLGFTGGHNRSIKEAVDSNFDYVWLLNNDTIVYKNTLTELVSLMEMQPNCGSTSPIIHRLGNPDIVDFCGATHDWLTLSTVHPKSVDMALDFCSINSDQLWLAGTAILFRVKALKTIGNLSDKLFAYYEDNDIGVRLINSGWHNSVTFSSSIEHACFDGVITERKPHYFYLMSRNSFLFYLKHTPNEFRKALRLRLLDNSLAVAENLHKLGHADKANACLLGIADGLAGVGGPPSLNRRVPLWLQCLRPFGRWWNRKRR